MIPYHSIAERLFNVPLLVAPQAGEITALYILGRMRHGSDADATERPIEQLQAFRPIENADGSVELNSPRANRFVGETVMDEETGRPAPYRMTKDGTAIITIIGKLVHRGAWVGASSGVVSYEGLKHQIAMVTKDKRVKRTLLDMASPGGEVVGCFDLAASVRKAAAVKPITGFVNGMACSAMYGVAAGCTRIVSLPEGQTGSIGVLMMHLDIAMALQMEGIKPTLIFAGAHKVDGNPFEALPKGVQADFQARIDATYGMFVDCVVAGRKNLTVDAIRATEARYYMGDEAKKLGLIDAVGTFEDLLMEMADPETVSISINQGDAKADAEKGDNMSFKDEMRAFLGMAPVSAAPADSTVLDVPLGVITQAANIESAAQAEAQAEIARLRGELTRRDAEAAATKAAQEKEVADLRATTIGTEADAFMLKNERKFGKASAEPFRRRYVAAKTAGDAEAGADIEAAVAGLPDIGETERVSSAGPTADQIVASATLTPDKVGPTAVARLKGRGIKPGNANWQAEYAAEVGKIEMEMGVTRATA